MTFHCQDPAQRLVYRLQAAARLQASFARATTLENHLAPDRLWHSASLTKQSGNKVSEKRQIVAHRFICGLAVRSQSSPPRDERISFTSNTDSTITSPVGYDSGRSLHPSPISIPKFNPKGIASTSPGLAQPWVPARRGVFNTNGVVSFPVFAANNLTRAESVALVA
jgi:hypothetical protein